MKVLVKNPTREVVAISSIAETVSNGIKLDEYIYGISVDVEGNFVEELPDIIDIEVIPEGVMPQKYKYIDGAFVINEGYVEFKTPEQEIAELKSQNAQIVYTLVMNDLM